MLYWFQVYNLVNSVHYTVCGYHLSPYNIETVLLTVMLYFSPL